MARRRYRRRTFAQQMLELAVWSPYVIAHRMRGSDRDERSRMVVEKFAAGIESWNALAMHVFTLQGALLRSMLRHRTWGSFAASAPFSAWLTQWRQTERGLSASAAPFHRRATANARRLTPRVGSARRSPRGNSLGR